jgi:glycyl-tRNA synthetase beta chain
MPDFLLEIGCEEIPARMIDAAREELQDRVMALLVRERIKSAPEALQGGMRSYSTPRRIAVATGVLAQQPDVDEQVMGPSVKVAYKDGQPAPPAEAFAKKVGLPLSAIEKVSTPKGEYLAAKVTKKGRSAAEILAELLPREIGSIYWPKSMYWRKTGERFVRPVRWLVAMLDDRVLPLEFDGVQAGNVSHGHRLLRPGTAKLPQARDYLEVMQDACVIARPENRLQRIRQALDAATRTIEGARWREDKELLETVVNLTEFPSVILGSFGGEFLDLPEEVLVTVMRDHQKYFAVEDADGRLLPNFLAVLNTDRDREGIIRHGHERVLRARFNDARFFWETDQKHPLRERAEWLKAVTFQKDLGSYYEKTLRIQRLASWLCELVKEGGLAVRPGVVHKAGYLAKTDLTTELVKEFTELQGIVGGLYARVQELDPDLPEGTRLAIADAIYDQYKPESVDDKVPRTLEGAVLSIADKSDSIAGMFALGLIPSGSKDPFALRRQANGIVRTIAEHKLPLLLGPMMIDARSGYRGSQAEKKFPAGVDYPQAIDSFFRERVEFYLKDVLSFRYDVVNAVLAAGADDVVDAVARAEAVSKARPSQDFESISVAFKRMKNILRQAEEKGMDWPAGVDRSLMTPPEQELLDEGTHRSIAFNASVERREYFEALNGLVGLRSALDTFFEKVMVMTDETKLRGNRLALLSMLQSVFLRVADFSEIVTEGKTG